MTLSGDLLVYAEHIWLRFPEVFIALGSPAADEIYDLRSHGAWRHSVVDGKSERVVEVVMPRRCPSGLDGGLGEVDERSTFEDLTEDMDFDDDDFGDGGGLSSPPSALGAWRSSTWAEMQLDRLSRSVAKLEGALDDCVCREVRSQLCQCLHVLAAAPEAGSAAAAFAAAVAALPDAAAMPEAQRPSEWDAAVMPEALRERPPDATYAQAPAEPRREARCPTFHPAVAEARGFQPAVAEARGVQPAVAGGQPVVAEARRFQPAVAEAQPVVAEARKFESLPTTDLEAWRAHAPEPAPSARDALRLGGVFQQDGESGSALARGLGVGAESSCPGTSVLARRRGFLVDPVDTQNLRRRFPPNSVTRLPAALPDSPGTWIQSLAAQPHWERGGQNDSTVSSPGEPRYHDVGQSAGEGAERAQRRPQETCERPSLALRSDDEDNSPGARIQRAAEAARRRFLEGELQAPGAAPPRLPVRAPRRGEEGEAEHDASAPLTTSCDSPLTMTESFMSGEDLHSYEASRVMSSTEEERIAPSRPTGHSAYAMGLGSDF